MTAVGDTLYTTFGGRRFRVLAEVTDVKIYYNRQYAFLTLVEKSGGEIAASAGAVIWRDHFYIIREFEKATGASFSQNLELVLEVEVQFHNRYGLRISISGIDASFTLGKLEQERQKTLAGLVAQHPDVVWMRDGEYRSANHLLRLPLVIQQIALISAPGSDGRRDFLHELGNNAYGIDYAVTEFPAQVQGDAAAGQIGVQMDRIANSGGAFHAVAIVRGGGSNTDFSAFDSHRVALAVAGCPVPVFTGIGHERNVSITDMLCHSPQKTPTKCAAGITEHNLEFLAFVQNAASDLKMRSMRMLGNFRQQTEHVQMALRRSAKWLVDREKQWLIARGEHVKMADPANTLNRGFVLIYRDGRHIPRGAGLQPGDAVEIRFADQTVKAKIYE